MRSTPGISVGSLAAVTSLVEWTSPGEQQSTLLLLPLRNKAAMMVFELELISSYGVLLIVSTRWRLLHCISAGIWNTSNALGSRDTVKFCFRYILLPPREACC